MESDLEKFHRLKDEGYRLTEKVISVNRSITPSEVVTLTLKKEDKEIVFSSLDPELFSYVIHLMSIPHLEDEDSDFVYVDYCGDVHVRAGETVFCGFELVGTPIGVTPVILLLLVSSFLHSCCRVYATFVPTFMIGFLMFFVCAFLLGLIPVVLKLKGRYLIAISLVFWAVVLAIFVRALSNWLYYGFDFVVVFACNIVADLALVMGYYYREEQGRVGTPKSFLKNCVSCGKEIPIAELQCPYCGSRQD